MRALLAIVVVAALAWSGWWYFGAQTRKGALESWLDERRQAGWVADAAEIRVSGYPNRIDTTVRDLELADPVHGWAWSAEAFELLSLSYKPHHFIAAWPGTQTVGTPVERLEIEGETLRASVVFRPDTRLQLDRTTLEMEGARINSTAGWSTGIESALLATRQAEGDAEGLHAHDVSLEAANLRLPETLTGGIVARSGLPGAIGTLDLDATLGFDRPWERATVEDGTPLLTSVDLRDASLSWGELDLRGRGRISADDAGYAEGEITVRARNWRDMIDFAEETGALSDGLAAALRTGLDLIARFSGDGGSLEVPLVFEDGRTRLGPIALGPAPRLAAR